MNGIRGLMKQTPEISFALFAILFVRIQGLMAVCEPGSRSSPDRESARALNLTVRSKLLLFISLPILGNFYSSLNKLRHS